MKVTWSLSGHLCASLAWHESSIPALTQPTGGQQGAVAASSLMPWSLPLPHQSILHVGQINPELLTMFLSHSGGSVAPKASRTKSECPRLQSFEAPPTSPRHLLPLSGLHSPRGDCATPRPRGFTSLHTRGVSGVFTSPSSASYPRGQTPFSP